MHTLKVFARNLCYLGLLCKGMMRLISLHAANYVLGEEKNFDFSVFFEKIFEISDEFNDTFANFDLLNTKAEVFSNPIEVDVEPQPLHLQQKSC